MPPKRLVKMLVYLADGRPVAALVRGDHEANEAKLAGPSASSTWRSPARRRCEKATGAPMGFLGPVGIKIPIVVDDVGRRA